MISIKLVDISPTKIDGKGDLIQVCETTICRGRIIIDSSQKNDNTTIAQSAWTVEYTNCTPVEG